MSNKVKFGLKNLYIASVTVGEGNAITFGTPVSWPGSVSLTMDPQGESNPFYADDSKFYVSTSNDGYEVTVETDVQNGLPNFAIVGLPDASISEARDRIRSAIKNSGFSFPKTKIIFR